MHLCVCVWVANDSLKAENKWTDGFVRPARLVLGTPHISTAERHEVKVALVVSTPEFSLYLHEAVFALHLGPFSPASEELFEPKCGR